VITPDAWSFHIATSYAGGPEASAAAAAAAPREPIQLPEPAPLSLSLDAALAQRASCRRFVPDPLEPATLAALLRAAYGTQPEVDFEGTRFQPRPVPSAGAAYPLEIHVLAQAVTGIDRGSYRYDSESHGLVPTGPGPVQPSIEELFLDQPYIAPAAAVVVLAAALMRTMPRYGDRGYRYVLFEAGHAAQNIVLAAAALQIGSLALGGFLDDVVSATLRLQPEVVPLYGIAIGPAATLDRDELRKP
jgi:SagB-type dehydrogenase family enzyme